MPKGTGQVRQESQTTSTSPWSGQAPYLRGMYEGAQNLPLQQHYPGQSVASQSPETQAALGMTATTALGGANQPRVNQQNRTLQGDYLYGNPGFDAAQSAMMDAAHNKIAPMVQGQFEAGGRYGGGLQQEAEYSALADAFAGPAMQQYGMERQNQMQAMGMASPAYMDAAALGQVGAQQDAYQQAQLSDQMNRWNFNQQAPYDRLAAQNAVIQGGYPGSDATSQNFGPPSVMDAVGADASAQFKNPFNPFAGIGNARERFDSYGPGV